MIPWDDSAVHTGRLGSARIAILTIIHQELEVARDVFGLTQNIPNTRYYVAKLNEERNYDMVLCKAGDRGNGPSQEAVGDLVEHFRPGYIFLVGIAGGAIGRDGIGIGDVIISNYTEYYEFMKIEAGKMLSRRTPYDHPSLYLRADIAEPLQFDENWIHQITCPRPQEGSPRAIVGHIAAGEKLFDDANHDYQREILSMCDKALGVDMESFGVGRAVFHARRYTKYNPLYLVIRGVSDPVLLPVGPTESLSIGQNSAQTREVWRRYAAAGAAAFAHSAAKRLLDSFAEEIETLEVTDEKNKKA